MEIRYDIENSVIQVDSVDLYAHTLDKNFIGVCSNCNSDVNSLSYHSYESGMIVAARCSLCDTIFAIMYDENWKWKGEETISKFFNLKSSNDLRNLEGIDRKKLSTIFTPAETTSMYAKARGEKYIRQYLYRARKKYNDFEELFGIQINI